MKTLLLLLSTILMCGCSPTKYKLTPVSTEYLRAEYARMMVHSLNNTQHEPAIKDNGRLFITVHQLAVEVFPRGEYAFIRYDWDTAWPSFKGWKAHCRMRYMKIYKRSSKPKIVLTSQ